MDAEIQIFILGKGDSGALSLIFNFSQYISGWSDLALIAIFEIGHISEFISKISAKFLLSKITGALKMNIFWENLQIPSFYFKEQSSKRKFEIENLHKICRPPKWPNNLTKENSKFLEFLFIFSD